MVPEFTELFRCECSSNEHIMIIDYYTDDDDEECYVSVHLAPKSFFGRLKHAISYVAGKQCKYGSFEEIVLSKQTAEKMRDALTGFIQHGELLQQKSASEFKA